MTSPLVVKEVSKAFKLPHEQYHTLKERVLHPFKFRGYNRLDATAANNDETKRIQLSMNVRRTGSTLVAANTTLVLASYILRNKVAN